MATDVGYYQVPAPENSSILIVPIAAAYLLYEGDIEADELNREWAEQVACVCLNNLLCADISEGYLPECPSLK